MALETNDELKMWRCPPLGGGVPFKYCRTMNEQLPCQSIEQCWASRIDVAAFLAENYSEEQLKQIFAPQPGRVAVILETLSKFSHNEK